MTDCPTIHAYISTDAPDALRWIAFYRAPEPTPVAGKKPVTRPFLPMYFAGPTREIVMANANEFWREQQELIARKEELSAERSERMKHIRAKSEAPTHPNLQRPQAAQ